MHKGNKVSCNFVNIRRYLKWIHMHYSNFHVFNSFLHCFGPQINDVLVFLPSFVLCLCSREGKDEHSYIHTWLSPHEEPVSQLNYILLLLIHQKKELTPKVSGLKGAWFAWLTGCRPSIRHTLLCLTLRTSLWGTGRAHQFLAPTIQENIPVASSHQASASDCRREGTTFGLCRQRSQDKVGPTLEGTPTRETDTRSRLALHSHTGSQAPDVHPPLPSDQPLHPNVGTVS